MTKSEKAMVLQLRSEGYSFYKIADKLSISVNTVKSFCSRNKNLQLCIYCGASIQQPKKVRRKKYCNDKCRMLWWKTHYSELNKKAIYSFKCENCGIAFQAYGNNHRKYCSRKCYVNARFGGNNDEIS